MAEKSSWMNNAATDFEGFSRWLTKLFRAGVATGWTVTQRGAGANMSVDIAAGDGAPMTTDTAPWDWSTAIKNVVDRRRQRQQPPGPGRGLHRPERDQSIYFDAQQPGALEVHRRPGHSGYLTERPERRRHPGHRRWSDEPVPHPGPRQPDLFDHSDHQRSDHEPHHTPSPSTYSACGAAAATLSGIWCRTMPTER